MTRQTELFFKPNIPLIKVGKPRFWYAWYLVHCLRHNDKMEYIKWIDIYIVPEIELDFDNQIEIDWTSYSWDSEIDSFAKIILFPYHWQVFEVLDYLDL